MFLNLPGQRIFRKHPWRRKTWKKKKRKQQVILKRLAISGQSSFFLFFLIKSRLLDLRKVWLLPYRKRPFSSHPPGAVFQARLLDNQEGAATERYILGRLRKALGEMFLAPTFFWHRLCCSICGDTEHGKSAEGDGCDIHCGTGKRCTAIPIVVS